jgi:cell division protease FtsH
MATTILTENREGLTTLAELLLEKEVVFAEDLERIYGKRKKQLEAEAEEQRKAEEKGAEENKEQGSGAEQESVAPAYTITEE